MSEQPELFSPLGKQASQFTWLLCDALLFFILLSLFLFYKDMVEGDESMRFFIQRYFLYCIGFFLLTAFHLLAYHRHDDSQIIAQGNNIFHSYKQFPGWYSYGIFLLKALWTGIFIVFSFRAIP